MTVSRVTKITVFLILAKKLNLPYFSGQLRFFEKCALLSNKDVTASTIPLKSICVADFGCELSMVGLKRLVGLAER